MLGKKNNLWAPERLLTLDDGVVRPNAAVVLDDAVCCLESGVSMSKAGSRKIAY